ncbi:hypothetical protein IQ06DRAFT_293895 [Phaeosphaeriaceae sp. SRC1lsM3a]|nr:hypothetical protein IQ06DRAFT_293895 [Stagonospora sp. SRC1lsM3a]
MYTIITYSAFLIDPTFWSRIGFLISFIATSLIAIEVLRLVGTDANKREVEKFLESYSKQRTASTSPARRSRRDEKHAAKIVSVNIDELEAIGRPITPPVDLHATTTTSRHVRAAATPESAEQKLERRKRATSTSQAAQAHRTSSPTPIRKLRKRSDTLTSTGSSESRRRHREASPASEAGSRHGSPRPKSSRKDSGLGLSKLIRAKV